MRKQFTFKKSDLENSYVNPTGCPIYTAMKRSEIPVFSVGPTGWLVDDHRTPNGYIPFSRSLQVASNIISAAYGDETRVNITRRNSLIGKSFKVSFKEILK